MLSSFIMLWLACLFGNWLPGLCRQSNSISLLRGRKACDDLLASNCEAIWRMSAGIGERADDSIVPALDSGYIKALPAAQPTRGRRGSEARGGCTKLCLQSRSRRSPEKRELVGQMRFCLPVCVLMHLFARKRERGRIKLNQSR